MATCPICEATLRSEPVSRGPLNDVVSYDCHFCGKFGFANSWVTATNASVVSEINQPALIAKERACTSPINTL